MTRTGSTNIRRVVVRETGRHPMPVEVHVPQDQAWIDERSRRPETFLCGFLSVERALAFCLDAGWEAEPE